MKVCDILAADHANGPGMRVSVFVSGCRNHCPGCFNPETWDFAAGRAFTPSMEDAIINELKKPGYQGITILGGEPFEAENQPGILALLLRVKEEVPKKDIWAYTGYCLETDLSDGGKRHTEVTDLILDLLDVLVDGRFVLEEKDITLRFRGSRNQRLIDMKRSREKGKVIQWEE